MTALLRAYALPKLGHLPIASISAADVERALSELIGQRTRQGSGPRSIRHVWNTLRRMFIYAMQHDAIVSNPLDRVASQRIRRPAIGNCSRRTRWLPRRSPS